MNTAYNMDCLEAMRRMPDKAFDLAVVDPPYGNGNAAIGGGHVPRIVRPIQNGGTGSGRGSTGTSTQAIRGAERTGGTRAAKYGKTIIAWDVAPGKEYFEQLFRVSRQQIIWGGNYFELPATRCFLVWDKCQSENFSMAMAEYAWCSFNDNAKIFRKPPMGKPGERFHPTQKPVELYAWIFARYAKPGMRILDTHLGSGSSRIAAYDAGLDFEGYEIDKTYFDKQEERFKKHTRQINMFVDCGVQFEEMKPFAT